MSSPNQIVGLREMVFDLLSKAGVHSRMKFNEVDIDFSNIEGFSELSVGDTKQLFSEYQTFAAKREKEEARVGRIKSKEALHNLLDDWIDDFDPEMSFHQFASVCHEMPFWSQMELEEIEAIFQDFVEDFEDKYMYKVKERHFQLKRDCFNFLDRVVFPRGQVLLDHISWTRANEAIRSDESFGTLDDLDKFDVYEDVFRDRLEETKAEKRRIVKRIARKKREAFTMECLETRRTDIASGIKWQEFVPLIKTSEAYLNLIGTKNCSQPYDLFAEYRSNLKKMP